MENETKHIVKIDEDTEITIKIPQYLTKKSLQGIMDKVERISDIVASTDADIQPEKQEEELRKKLKKSFKKMSSPEKKPFRIFSDEMCDYIKTRVEAGDSVESIARLIGFKFKVNVNAKQVYDKIHNMRQRKQWKAQPKKVLSKRHRTGVQLFTKEMSEMVNKWTNEGSSPKAIANMLNSIYGTNITIEQVNAKIYNMKYANKWVDAEKDPEQQKKDYFDLIQGVRRNWKQDNIKAVSIDGQQPKQEELPVPPDPKPEEQPQQPQPQPEEEKTSSSSTFIREIFDLKKFLVKAKAKKKKGKRKYTIWTPEREEFLKELTRLGLKPSVIRDTIRTKFGIRLATRKVTHKQYSLGLK